MLRFEQLLQFGTTYFPSKTCNSMPGWHLSLMPESHMDYEEVRAAHCAQCLCVWIVCVYIGGALCLCVWKKLYCWEVLVS